MDNKNILFFDKAHFTPEYNKKITQTFAETKN